MHAVPTIAGHRVRTRRSNIGTELRTLLIQAEADGSLRRLRNGYHVLALWLLKFPALDPKSVRVDDIIDAEPVADGMMRVGSHLKREGWKIPSELFRRTLTEIVFRNPHKSDYRAPAFMDGHKAITHEMLLEALRRKTERTRAHRS